VIEDPYELLKEAVAAAEPGYKNSKQMHEDFRSLFFSTPTGKRVFNQIMEICGFFRTAVVKGDPYATHVREGEKNIAAAVWATCLHEAKELPTRTTSRREHNG